MMLINLQVILAILTTVSTTGNAFIVVEPLTKQAKQSLSSSPSSSLYAKKEATFGMGCFWKPSEELLKVPGVIDTVVGYTGNPQAKDVPDYNSVCYSRQWVEGVRVYYDDTKISYEQLLDEFFEKQESKPGSRQYGSYIFPHNVEQSEVANTWLTTNEKQNRVRKEDGFPIQFTVIEPLSAFYQAEGYHQQYWQKQRPRLAFAFALIAIMTLSNRGGMITTSLPEAASIIHTVSESIFLGGGVYILLERFVLDKKVVEL